MRLDSERDTEDPSGVYFGRDGKTLPKSEKGEFGEREEGRSQLVELDESQ